MGTAERCQNYSKGMLFFGLDNGVHYNRRVIRSSVPTAQDQMLKRIEEINANPMTREEFGKVWDTRELAELIVVGIQRRLLRGKRRRDGAKLWLTVQEMPRLYYGFKACEGEQGDGE